MNKEANGAHFLIGKMGLMKMACFTRYTTLAAIFFSAFSYSSLSNARGVKSVTIEEVGKSSMEECSHSGQLKSK
jgi:hypothetical protein